ncbi:MAG: hypothetical protein H9897_01390 [Candidatus Ureaplasma intestinipullorum]|uniref:Uncharacterized protein n=1 Tax=Candidatus Ureaplasma intestinipullorum TaxID=2838770 RepID=A0A9E2KWL0_9BACT|nr:hypothetical protein [Candidatus Ureaplasma intestinipullorum]
MSRKTKKLFNTTKKGKKIFLITGLSTVGAAVIAIPTGLALSNNLPNSDKHIIKLNDDFLKNVSTFILQNKISSSDEFNQNFKNQFANFLSEKFKKANFVAKSNQDKLSIQITNDFDFDTEIQLGSVVFLDSKNLEMNVSWYNPVQFSIPANTIFSFVQDYIDNHKISSLSNLAKNKDFKQQLVSKINELNPSSRVILNVDDIILNSSSSYSLTISIQSYIDKTFTLTNTDQNSSVSINDPEYQKEILINDLVPWSAKIAFRNETVNKIQELSMQQGLIAPSYFFNSDTITVTNNAFINSLIDILNTGLIDEYKVDRSSISNISYTIINKNSVYQQFEPNVAEVKFTLTLSNGYFTDDETSRDNFTLSNNNRTVSMNLYVYNGLFINQHMSSASTNINNFISANNISLSNANDAINSEYGSYAEFWYTLLTGDSYQNVTDEYISLINPNLYQMEFNETSISITLNENCGFRFYGDSLQNGDIVISNNYRTITINNIVWAKGTVNISTTYATLATLTDVFTRNAIYDPSLIDSKKQVIINRLFPHLPVEKCSILYDNSNNTITFTINNSPDAITNYMFDVNGIATNVFKISNVTFPVAKIRPIQDYANLVQNTIFQNLISDKTELQTYLPYIISQMFRNSLNQGQYTTSIDSTNTSVTITINSDVNLEFVTTGTGGVETTSKTFTFNINLCKKVNIINDYQTAITPQALQTQGITAENLQSHDSIVKILKLIVDSSTADKDNLINSIADLLAISYSPAPNSSRILIKSSNSAVIQNPFTFVVNNANVNSINIVFDFSVTQAPTTPTTPNTKQNIMSRFFRGY